jgi:CheY-like chemotaxis protein
MRTQTSTNESLNTKLLLKALVAFKKGDFSVRLPGEWTGEAGKIADTLNDIIELSDKTTKEVERVSRVVGKEGKSEGSNRGATFTVSLPVATNVRADGNEKPATVETDGNGLPRNFSTLLKGLRILIVDDEVDSRELVTAIVNRCGGEVKCCESAVDALKSFKAWKPHLLVSDIGMPNVDGYTLIKKLRKLRLKLAKQIPAIALTAYATDDDRARSLAAGFQMHISKPIEPVTLVKSIAGAVGRKV